MSKAPVILIGGAFNNTLKNWLLQLGIDQVNHISVHLEGIAPEEVEKAAERIRDGLPVNAMVITVGALADRLLNTYFVVHGALPATSCKDKKRIEAAIGQCRNYLIMRSYYGNQSTGGRIS